MLRTVLFATVCMLFFPTATRAQPTCGHLDHAARLLKEDVVNLVYTMRDSCRICYQQASRLPLLKRYLEKKGIKTHMIVGVSHSADRLAGLLPHVQVNNRHVWRALGMHNNHFYVIDRCGRMVFEIINPWSNLNFPFVRSAVVATQHGHPCGLCPADYTHVHEEKKEAIVEFPKISESSEYIPEVALPLKMVLKVRHMHKGDSRIYKHIIKVPEVPKYHGHLENDGYPSNNHNRKQTIEVEEGKDHVLDALRRNASIEAENRKINSLTQSINPTRNATDSIKREFTTSSHFLTESTLDNSEKFNNQTASNHNETAVVNKTTISDVSEPMSNDENKEEEISKDYYEEDPPDPKETGSLTKEQFDEKEALKRHYTRILDWIAFSSDYE